MRTDSPFRGAKFNIIRYRGDPKTAITLSGHKVEKQEYIFYKDDKERWQKVRAMDYHGEHFVYLDPLYDKPEGKGHWAFMCTCGSPAVIVGPGTAVHQMSRARERMLVCYIYTLRLHEFGYGSHATGGGRWV